MSKVASTNVFEALSRSKAKAASSSKEEEAGEGPAPPLQKGKLSTASSRLNCWADSDEEGGGNAFQADASNPAVPRSKTHGRGGWRYRAR